MTHPPHGPRRRGGVLTPEDEEVWRLVTRTLKPLKHKRVVAGEHPRPAQPRKAAPAKNVAPREATAAPPPIPAHKPPPRMQPIEDKLKRKLARGRVQSDMKIDLHGMRQAEAHAALDGFIRRARSQGARVVTIVTGKGRGSSADDPLSQPGGVLRRMVRHWLAAPDLRDCVIGYDEADAAHGGAGALYVRIRRDRGLRVDADRT